MSVIEKILTGEGYDCSVTDGADKDLYIQKSGWRPNGDNMVAPPGLFHRLEYIQ